jgi:hypothetical protein
MRPQLTGNARIGAVPTICGRILIDSAPLSAFADPAAARESRATPICGRFQPNGPEVAVRSGQAVYWSDGELHRTRTESGLLALIIEGEFAL